MKDFESALLTWSPLTGAAPFQVYHSWADSLSAHQACVSLRRELRLTKNLRGGLVFLDDHMSSSRRNIKHLKVTFAKYAAAAAEAVAAGAEELGKKRQKQVTLADTNTWFAAVDITND